MITQYQTLVQEDIQIDASKKLIHDILDHALMLIQVGEVNKGVEHLAIRLSKVLASHGTDALRGWIRVFCQQHPINTVLLQSPFTQRCVDKPRGYAGDAVLIDYIYKIGNLVEPHTAVGKAIHDAMINSYCCDSVRWRAQHLGNEINQLAAAKGRKISAISIASGHLRELSFVHNFEDKIANFIGLDQDEASNNVAKQSYPYKNLFIFDESIRFVLSRKLPLESFDMVYSTGLFDYLDDKLAARMTQRMFELVAPGGTMIIPNFGIGVPEQGYMEAFMDWNLIYRTENQVLDFLSEIDHDTIHHKEVYSDKSGNIHYLKVQKK